MTDQKQKDLAKAMSGVTQALTEMSRRAGIRDEIRKWILRALADGKLVAYGFSMEDEASHEPVEIPVYMFTEKFVNWSNSSFKGRGKEFVEARVLRTSKRARAKEAIAPNPGTQMASRNPVGRPTQRAVIDAAIEALETNGVDFSLYTTRQNAHSVRRRVSELTGRATAGVSGFTDETIRRRIAKRRDDDLKNPSG